MYSRKGRAGELGDSTIMLTPRHLLARSFASRIEAASWTGFTALVPEVGVEPTRAFQLNGF